MSNIPTSPEPCWQGSPGPSTHMDGGLVAAEDPAQPLQVPAALPHRQTQLLQLLFLLLQGTELLIHCSLCDTGQHSARGDGALQPILPVCWTSAPLVTQKAEPQGRLKYCLQYVLTSRAASLSLTRCCSFSNMAFMAAGLFSKLCWHCRSSLDS